MLHSCRACTHASPSHINCTPALFTLLTPCSLLTSLTSDWKHLHGRSGACVDTHCVCLVNICQAFAEYLILGPTSRWLCNNVQEYHLWVGVTIGPPITSHTLWYKYNRSNFVSKQCESLAYNMMQNCTVSYWWTMCFVLGTFWHDDWYMFQLDSHVTLGWFVVRAVVMDLNLQ